MQVRDIFLKHFRTVRLNTRFKIKEESIFGRGGGGGWRGCIRLLIFTSIPWFLGFADPLVQSSNNVIQKFEKTLGKQNEPTMASAMPRNTANNWLWLFRAEMSTIGSFLFWRVFELNRKILFHRNIRTQLGEDEFVIKGLSYITALFSEFAMCLKLQPGWKKLSSPYNKYK